MMNTIRLNITLPHDLGLKVKATPNHSALIAEALRAKFAEDEATKLAKVLAEGYAARAGEDVKVNDEFDQMIGDGAE